MLPNRWPLFSMLFASMVCSLISSTFGSQGSVFAQVQQPAIGELDVIAVRVQFVADTTELTSGTGIFGPDGYDGLGYLLRDEDTRIDPLPHNQAYFETHLEFARNYFLKSSDGQLDLDYRVLPEVVQLDHPIAYYSPIGEDFTLEKLALFMQDVWEKVDASGQFDPTGLDPETTAFVIFHAGVGRDIELTGTSLDITPFDLPSLYLKEAQIQSLLGDPSFEGFPIDDGRFLIKNSMIIPRTQSRRGEDIGGNEVVFPLSINGLLCASIGSHLGLPDLFNTSNGSPAIGRFGLMDGAGFFSYNGLFPPEPSAWEKVALGWIEPVNITESAARLESVGNLGTLELNPASAQDEGEAPQMYRWDISSSEYFLIEYRNRDVVRTGVELTIQTPEGARVRQRFTNQDTDFIYQYAGFDTLLTAGTLVNVSDFDWSLPGGLDVGPDEQEGTDDDRELNGGLLIWHIDEAVIERAYQDQAMGGSRGVNADPYYRGVDLEEADGAQDIGLEAGLLDNSPSFGYAYDFWWEGNNYRVVTENGSIDLNPENRFGPDTYPSNASNAGGRQYFELYDIQATGPKAQFSIRYAATNAGWPELMGEFDSLVERPLQPEETYYQQHSLHVGRVLLQGLNGQADTLLVIPSETALHALPTSALSRAEALAAEDWIWVDGLEGMVQPVMNNRLVTAERRANDSELRVRSWELDGDSLKSLWSQVVLSELGGVGLSEQMGWISSNVAANSPLLLEYLGVEIDANGQVSGADWEAESAEVNGVQMRWSGSSIDVDGWSDDQIQALVASGLISGSNRAQWIPMAYGDGARFVRVSETEVGVYDPYAESTDVSGLTGGNGVNEAKYTLLYRALRSDLAAEWPEISADGGVFRVNSLDNTLEGYHLSGALLDYFPMAAPDSVQWLGSPLLADVDGDEEQDILVLGENAYSTLVYGFNRQAELLDGFPLLLGSSVSAGIDGVGAAGVANGTGVANGIGSRVIQPAIIGKRLVAVSPDGSIKIWNLPRLTSAEWPSRMGAWGGNRARQDQGNDAPGSTGQSAEILIDDETYNWPNPAQDVTHLRFQTSEAGQLSVQIITLSGRKIWETELRTKGGVPEEITIDTSQWSSGAYIALVKATVYGKTANKLVKIAITK